MAGIEKVSSCCCCSDDDLHARSVCYLSCSAVTKNLRLDDIVGSWAFVQALRITCPLHLLGMNSVFVRRFDCLVVVMLWMCIYGLVQSCFGSD